MSVPEPDTTEPKRERALPLVRTTPGMPAIDGRAGQTRTARTVVWLGCHLGELAGVGVPGVLAATVSPWWATLSGAVALVWVAHEYHTHHNRPPSRTEPGTGGDRR